MIESNRNGLPPARNIPPRPRTGAFRAAVAPALARLIAKILRLASPLKNGGAGEGGTEHETRLSVHQPQSAARLAAALALLSWLAGCAGMDLSGPLASSPPTGTVTRVEALWTDTELRDASRAVARGFTGRIYLFGRDSDEPIIAPGNIAVYTFDNTESSAEPKFVWRFKDEDLRKVVDKTIMGWSYALWLPWEAGGEAANCTVIVKYTSPDGRTIVSAPGRVRLPALPKLGGDTRQSAQVTSNAAKSLALNGIP